jgi:YVTN family beta-propeller protein
VEFRILGPLEVVGGRDGASLEPAPKVRALLGVLLLHPNEVVSSERLIDELWGDRPPATAAKIVQTYISQVRRGLEPDAVVTRAPGYVLRVESGALDADRFRLLVAEARELAAGSEHAQARRLYREALGLWRGPPLAGMLFESFARSEVEQLAEERLSALMDLADCELALGHCQELVPELETLVRQYPLRERLRAQLMLALYGCGRQADALAVYADARHTLVEELGLEPGSELQELQRAILAHDAGLVTPARARPAASVSASRRLARKPALALALALLLALALGIVYAFPRDRPRPILLAPNSVGFIDAASGRVTKSFAVSGVPSSLALANGSLWVANSDDETVTRIDATSGRSITIPVGGHPTGLAANAGALWVWTLEGSLVPIDPRFNSAGTPILLGAKVAMSRGGEITMGDGFIWVAAPLTAVVRVDPTDPRHRRAIVPDDGLQGAIAYHGRELWVAGADQVFPIAAATGIPEAGVRVGVVQDLVFAGAGLWVVSGGPAHVGGIAQALRRVDPHSDLVLATIAVGSDPVSVVAAGGSVWVASRTDGVIDRVDPVRDRVVERIAVGAKPIALASSGSGVWVAAR